ncbi:Cerevisin [Drechslerella dactyloides]|uniref:Cerevisin n=1 Tax=Drechslerella dactyloides TaxID=74499 RepID=A0AAD6ITR4_DREDA|nr:Cerevisin [Drechslerella dactyloides]
MKRTIITISAIFAATASTAPSSTKPDESAIHNYRSFPVLRRQNNGSIVEQPNAPWNLERISNIAPINQAGRKITDEAYKYRYDARDTAVGVDVYVHDTGIDPRNPDFTTRAGIIFTENPFDIYDTTGHGTHVAGTIGSGHYGVAKNVSIWAIRTTGGPMEDPLGPSIEKNASVYINDQVNGIKAAMRLHGLRKKEKDFKGSVMNMSWGLPKDFFAQEAGVLDTLRNALKDAVAAGIHITIAGGNDDEDACDHFPAGLVKDIPSLIVVGNTDITDTRMKTSNWGSCIDLFAPGTEIKSTSLKKNNWVAIETGTSMSAPLVAGVVATQLAKNPDLRGNVPAMKKKILEMALKDVVKDAKGGANLLLNTRVGA